MEVEAIVNEIANTYASLTDIAKSEFVTNSKLLQVTKKTLLVKEGQYSDKLYYISKGGLRAFYLKDGKEISDWFAFDGFFICAINSFFSNLASEHYIEVLEDSCLLEIERESLEILCEKHHDFERLCRMAVTTTMLALQQRVVAIQFKTAKERYQELLEQFPFILQRVSLGYIASYLGISQETLSRLRSEK